MVFSGIVTTNPEVKRLHDAYGRPEKGQEWTHEEITDIIGENWKTSRYRTITTRWRRQVFRLYQLVIDAVPGSGFRVLPDPESLRYSDKQLKSSGRKLRKASDAALSVDERNLSQDERTLLNHRIAAYAKLRAYFKAEEQRKVPQLEEKK